MIRIEQTQHETWLITWTTRNGLGETVTHKQEYGYFDEVSRFIESELLGLDINGEVKE